MQRISKPFCVGVLGWAIASADSALSATLDLLPQAPEAAIIAVPSVFAGNDSSVVENPFTQSSIPRRPAFGTFDIQVNYSGDKAFRAAFDVAETFWESRVLGFFDPFIADFMGLNAPHLVIDASVSPIDGAGNTLGSAGARTFFSFSDTATGDVLAALTTTGVMNFDSADIAALSEDGSFEAVIIHEMAHVMGYSDFFWDLIGATDGTGFDTSYTGDFALAIYRE